MQKMQQIEVIKAEQKAGLISKKEAIMKYHGISEEEAQKKLDEIEKEIIEKEIAEEDNKKQEIIKLISELQKFIDNMAL